MTISILVQGITNEEKRLLRESILRVLPGLFIMITFDKKLDFRARMTTAAIHTPGYDMMTSTV